MLRTVFVIVIAAFGLVNAFRGPFQALLLYLWVAYFRPDQWVWNANLVRSLNLSYLSGLLTLLATMVSDVRWRINGRVVLLLLFAVHTALSTAWSDQPAIGWVEWVDFLKILLMSYALVVLVTDASRFRTVLLIIGLSLGFEGAKQGWAQLILNPGGMNTNELPQLGDNNGVAVGMLMLVPVLTTLAASADRWWEKWAMRFLAFGVVYRAISTYSRGGFLACAALGAAYLLRSPRRVPAVVGLVTAALLIAPVLPQQFWDRMSTIRAPGQISDEEDTSAAGRLHFWRVGLDMANDRPWFGVGFNAYNRTYDAYDDSQGRFGTDRSVHSVWFGVLSELGYPGLLLFLAQLGLAFGACRRARRLANRNPAYARLSAFAFALESGLVVFVVGGSFLPFQYTEIVWHFIGLSIALDLLARAGASAPQAAAPPSSPRAVAGLGMAR